MEKPDKPVGGAAAYFTLKKKSGRVDLRESVGRCDSRHPLEVP